MNLASFIISLITGILMFLVVFYMGDNSFSVVLFCGIFGFISNVLIGWNAKRKMGVAHLCRENLLIVEKNP